jgi:hypothetical protein
MKTIATLAMSSAIALSAFAFFATPEGAKAGPVVPPGHYCLSYDHGGTDCSFTSYAQCEATASGTDAVCSGPSFRDEHSYRNWLRSGEYHY